MNSAGDNQQNQESTVLVKALDTLLRPLVKLLLSFQITYPQLLNILKGIYVDVAESDFKVNGKRQSDSRITLLTGVHRKDVKRLRDETADTEIKPAAASLGAQLIGQWLGTDTYLDEDGNPKQLPLRKQTDGSPSFESLVQQVCKQDIRPRVILDEWLHLGVASIAQDKVCLNTEAFTPKQGFTEKAFFFGKNTRDHICAAGHNLLDKKPSYFDRSVYYDGLTERSIEELAKLAETLGMQALKEMNREALKRQKQDQDYASETYRMNFGVFNFNDKTKQN